MSASQPLSAPSSAPAGAPRGLGLRRNTLWTLAGNLTYAASQWGMLVVLAKLGTPELVGVFALGIALVTPVTMFLNLQLRAIQATDATGRFRFGEYLGLRLLTIGLSLGVLGALALALGLGPYRAGVVLLLGLGKGFESLSDLFHGACQHRERMDLIGRSLILKGVLSLAGLGLAMATTHELLWAVGAMACAMAATALAFDAPNARRLLAAETPAVPLTPAFEAGPLWRLAKLALPLGFVYLFATFTNTVPRYFVAHHLGEHALGVFSAIAYMLVAGSTVVNAVGQVASPRLAKLHAAGERGPFLRGFAALLGAGALIGAVGVAVPLAVGGPLLTLVYRPEYAAHQTVFVLVMAAGALSYLGSLLGYGLTAVRVYGGQMPLAGLVAAGTAAGCWWLVPRWGLEGAAGALLVGGALNVLGGAGLFGLTWRRVAEAR